MDSAKIFIDTDNEITFILEKILASKSDRVCLVVPDRASLFTSISGLKLIKRVVDKSNKLLVLVTLDSNGSSLAQKACLIVVSRVGEITDILWEQAQKTKFEFVKKHKNRVYYQPDKKEEPAEIIVDKTKISIQELIKPVTDEIIIDQIQYKPEIELENIQNDFAQDNETLIHIENNTDFIEIPQIRIRVEDSEIDSMQEQIQKDIEEIPELTGKDSNLENFSENAKKSTVRMRRTSNENKNLSFQSGADIGDQKKN